MKHWLFQGNPDFFDIRGYIEDLDEITWSVRQKHFAPEIKVGDIVFIWMAKGSGNESGVVAQCKVVAEAEMIKEDEASAPYWKKPKKNEVALSVRLKVEKRCLGKKEIIKAGWLLDDPILSGHRIFKMRLETNYSLSAPEGGRLARLVENTGNDWTRSDSIAGLWAYSQTYGGVLSKKAGSPVANVALVVGRAVTGVYNKVLNFRAIDPRDDRDGLSGGGATDRAVWKEFFDEEAQMLHEDLLENSFRALYGTVHQSPPHKSIYEEYGEAPDDDVADWAIFALKIRRGQPKFRKNLLKLYGNKCAISGWGPQSVLEAAHIQPHAKKGVNKSENGILMRSDFHALFDSGLIRIHPQSLKVEIAQELNGTPYEDFDGTILRNRKDDSMPSEAFLRERYKNATG